MTFTTERDNHQKEDAVENPITITGYERFQWMRDALQKEGVKIPLPTAN